MYPPPYPERQSRVGRLVAVELAGVGVQSQNARDEEEQRAQQAVQQILRWSYYVSLSINQSIIHVLNRNLASAEREICQKHNRQQAKYKAAHFNDVV